jgi:tRNA(Ile)-lysidine synthase
VIKLLGKVPNSIYVACSGGVDSMAALSFLNNGKRNVKVAHFDHGTIHASDAQSFVEKYCDDQGLELELGTITRSRTKDESREEFWRNERYRFFKTLESPVITAHHLNDVAEWWVFSSLHGESKLIPYSNDTVLRPFLLTTKSELIRWAKHRAVPHVTDPSNKNLVYMRNRIRHKIIPQCLKVNPGLEKVLRKKIEKLSEHTLE